MSQLTEKFCNVVGLECKSTSTEYRWRLASFESFLKQKYGIGIDSFFDSKFNVYEVLGGYHAYLREKGLAKSTISSRIATAKTFLEFNDVPISNTIFRLKVRPPKRHKPDKTPLTKEDVRNIILACKDTRLQTYVLFLATTGCRATEALSIRYKDINWDTRTVMLRAAYTKTKHQRFVFLTNECIKHLKIWKDYRERNRRIIHDKRIDKVTKPFKPHELFFTTGRFQDEEVTDPNSLYHTLVVDFRAVTDRNGFSERYENKGKRHKISFHSLRTFVKSTISDLGHGDYSEWFLGHDVSTYYSKTEKEKRQIFDNITPSL